MMLGSTIPVKAAFFFFGPTWCIISPVALADPWTFQLMPIEFVVKTQKRTPGRFN
jgi:hypothetical protein